VSIKSLKKHVCILTQTLPCIAPSAVPALSANEFFAGKRSAPNLVSLEDGKGVAGDALPPQTARASTAPTPTQSAPTPAPASVPAPQAAPAPAAVEHKLPEQTRAVVEPIARPASPVKAVRQNGHSESATSAPTSRSIETSKPSQGSDTDLKELKEEIESLKEEMAKRDNLIRKLEVENERLRANERRVREAIGSA
jgi:coronin-1B/1C/6